LFEGVFSRKIAGAEVYADESGPHAADLLRQCAPKKTGVAIKQVMVLHSDNGAPMKSST
jgi:putative transposase